MIKSFSRLKKQNKDKFNIPKSAQDIICVDTIYKDGIFKIGNRFSKSYRFLDINYSIASKEQKTGLFLDYGELLNSLDSSTMTKISINNRKIDLKQFKEDILIPMQGDFIDEYRKEYNEMLLDNLAKSDDIIQEKYITVTVFKNKVEDARTFFARVTTELSAHFAKLGSSCCELNTRERLKILHDFYRTGDEENFQFDMKDFARKGHSFKDAICPNAPVFKHTYFKLDDKYGRVLYLSSYARFIKDNFIAELCDFNKNMMYSMDIISIPTDEAVKELENKLLGVNTNITNWQRRQNANNNFSAVIPYDMETQREECKEFLDHKTTLVLKKPKTDSSIRRIWLPKTLAWILRKWKEEQDKYKEFFGDEYTDYDLVVSFENGRPCTHSSIRKSLEYVTDAAGLPKIVFHSFRHSSTTYKLKLNHGDIKATQGDTGHSQADMITEVYGHILDEDRKVNAQRFNDTFYRNSGIDIDHKEEKKTVDIDALVKELSKNPELMSQLIDALK